jgi:hypothetical protein
MKELERHERFRYCFIILIICFTLKTQNPILCNPIQFDSVLFIIYNFFIFYNLFIYFAKYRQAKPTILLRFTNGLNTKNDLKSLFFAP